MPKELIISANAHEKKVAIIEDGVVTEFYVERQNENTGVVGNIYKGRVMKVLPGMQSAFVDIGLERDAFLYVSDFLDLEDETFDFKDEGAVEKAAEKAEKAERPERTERTERPERAERAPEPSRQLAAAPKREEPAAEEADEDEEEEPDAAVEFVAAVATAPPDLVAVGDEEDEDEAGEAGEGGEHRKRRRRRRRRRGEEIAPGLDEYDVAPRPEVLESAGGVETDEDDGAMRVESAFDHIDELTFSDAGAANQAEPADEEAEPAYELPTFSFERISDDDVPPRERPARRSPIPELVEVVLASAYDEPEEPPAAQNAPVLISIRDDEPAAEPAEAKRSRSRKAPAAKAPRREAVDEAKPAARKARARKASGSEGGDGGDAADEAPKKGRARKAPPAEEAAEAKSRSRKSRAKKAGEATVDLSEDAEAAVGDATGRAEMATRRGGRNRRRPPREGRPEGEGGEESGGADAAEPADRGRRQGAPAQGGEGRRSEGGEGRRGEGEGRRGEGEGRRPEAEGRRGEGGEGRRSEGGEGRRSGGNGGNGGAGGAGGGAGRGARRGPEPLISELLHEGQEIIVQIAKEPIAKKGARITSHVVLPGRFLVYMPTVNRVGVSRKVGSESERARLKKIVAGLREREPGPGGFIARTAAIGQTEEDLLDDMRYLQRTWAEIKLQTERRKAPALLHRDLDLIQRILRDQISDDFSAIRVDNELEYARIVDFVNRVQPKLVRRVKLHTRDESILEAYGVQAEIDKAVKPRVWLKSGGYIVINQTEALVSVDVNTGKFVGKSDRLEDTITRTNMEAVKEVVRQVRLRDLGGIIVIDFIDMEERRNRMKVAQALEQELRADRSPSKVLGFNDFGLIIITRKRVKQSLERTLCSPCPYCQGAGLVKSTQTMAFEILSEARRLSKQYANEADDVTLRVSPDVANALRTSESAIFEEIEAHFTAPVRIKVDHELHQEQFDFAIL